MVLNITTFARGQRRPISDTGDEWLEHQSIHNLW